MAQFGLTSSDITAAINSLTNDNNEFRTRVNELITAQQQLSTMWTGDANAAFTTAFNADNEKWQAFAQLVDAYVATLNNILKIYVQAEAENAATAAKRSRSF